MESTEVLSNYIKKLGHPMKEIRERSLQLIIAKLNLGWQLDDELLCTRNLLESLLAWFKPQKPTLQSEALNLLLKIIKTKSGMYIVKELGVQNVISNLKDIKCNIVPDGIELFDDIIETLCFLNTAESENDLMVPPLSLQSSVRSGNKHSSNNDFHRLDENYSSNGCGTSGSKFSLDTNECHMSNVSNGIIVFLLPWVDLCQSDLKTIVLVEDALKVVKSTRRCCRFIRDVFLCDFEPEIFLNRSAIVNTLLMIADGQQTGHPGEALCTLLCITQALRKRLAQIFSIDLIHKTNKVSEECQNSDDNVNVELAHIAGGCPRTTRADDALIALRQMPAPIFALEVSHSILSIMSRSIVLLDTNENETVSIKELNTCLDLVDSLVCFLLECVHEQFWLVEHSTKSHKDIAHKSCMLMRILGELLIKYRKSFMYKAEHGHHRAAWLRLLSCAEKLLNWSKNSPLPPTSLIVALQSAQLDSALDLLYPELSKKVNESLCLSKSITDQEHKSKYKALKKLYVSMNYAVRFMQSKSDVKTPKEVLKEIQNSLPTIGLHNSEAFLDDISNILLFKSGEWDLDENDWSIVRGIALKIMAHNTQWVKVKFYQMFANMVRSVLLGDRNEREQCFLLLCDVAVLTEICCHGLSSYLDKVKESASDIMLHLLRGRLVLSESCWWRLLATMLPILPLLHVYAAHDTPLGKAICKSLEPDIIECMGVSFAEMVAGLTRLLFVSCVSVQLEASHALCRLLGDDRYLPPRESLRSDILLNALRRVEPQDFNLDTTGTVSGLQTTGLIQVLEVLKQDLRIDDGGKGYVACSPRPGLEPSLRRSTLQQLAVLMRQGDTHESFLQYDGLNLIVSLLRLSLLIDDYLAFPECALSCVSVLNSVCFESRHDLSKIADLPILLLRAVLVFPSNDACVLMCAQILALISWSGFALQEINSSRQKVPALPLCVTERTSLPFPTNSYWSKSPNAEHCSLEWLQSQEEWRRAIRVRWWWAWTGGTQNLRGVQTLHSVDNVTNRALAPQPAELDLAIMRAASPLTSTTKALLALENATSHLQVTEALSLLESYTSLVSLSATPLAEYGGLPWRHVRRFLCAQPASPSDTSLLTQLLQFIVAYMDNVPNEHTTMNWIKPYFIGNDATVITLLSRERLYPQQTPREDIEVTQLRIHIVKIVWRCIRLLETHDDYDIRRMESLLKILFACLDDIDLKNFHVLGYLNEMTRCIRYALHSRYCKLSEASLLDGVRSMIRVLRSCGDGGRKGQACHLDAMLALLAMLRQIHYEEIPVQRWSEAWSGEVLQAVADCARAERAELRASALQVMATLTHYTQLRPHLLQSIRNESLCQYAMEVFLKASEANVVRAAAADLLAAVASRSSSHSEVFENEIIEYFMSAEFVESCLQILVEFCNEKKYETYLKPNIPLSVLERRSELEVRAHKNGDVKLSPSLEIIQPPPTFSLVIAVSDVLHNISAFKSCPIEPWNDQGLFRVLFRCASWSCNGVGETQSVRAAACCALVAVSSRKCVRTSLAATKDCLVNLLQILTSSEQVDNDETSARTQTFQLLACLLSERAAIDTIWSELRERQAMPFFDLLIQSIETDEEELHDAAIYCLTQLTKSSLNRKHADKTIDESLIDFFNHLKIDKDVGLSHIQSGAGDANRSDECQPEYVCEELCKLLIYRFQDLFDKKKYLASQDDAWTRVCSCLCHLLSACPRSRLYGVHRHLPRLLLAALQAVRDQLSLLGKPVDVIRNANHDPVLQTLYWLLTIMNCLMLECSYAKESFAENITCSLNKLWPWCMMTEQLRTAIINLLVTFTNECPKAWACMCACVGGRSLLSELCALVGRSTGLLLPAVRILRQCASHHHCRTIILKSEVMACMGKTWRSAGSAGGPQCAGWARLSAALARYADGAGALLALPAQRPPHARLLPALARAAHHHRAAFLHAPDLLELLSASLLTGNTSEVVLASRAVWALAANNHRAKLVLRSAGVTSAVQSALQRMQRDTASSSSQALQLLTYTNSVLQAT